MTSVSANFKNKSETVHGTVNWIITDRCNYNCRYCFVSKSRHETGPKNTADQLKLIEKDTDNILKNIKNSLPGVWHFNIAGGEPFIHPFFFKIIKTLVKLNHRISIVSNFSVADEVILKFLKITGNNLIRFTASLHLDHITPDEFIVKMKRIIALSSRKKKFCSTLVIQRDKIKEVEAISKKFINTGILLMVRTRKDKDCNYINPSLEEKKIIRNNIKMLRELGGSEMSDSNFKIIEKAGNYGFDPAAISFTGKKCKAGSKYCVFLHNGEAYRCFPAMRDNSGFLGNIAKGTFKLKPKAATCQYRTCFCFGPTVINLIADVD